MEGLLEKIYEKEKENLPLQAYYWELKNINAYVNNRRFVGNRSHNTSKYEPYTFYKPILMLF